MKISLITTVFNNQQFIEQAINSVLSQTYPNIEYIIVDGGSTDGTLEIINKYRSRAANVISEPDKGLYDALNKGIKAATGDVVGILHSDDLFYDNQVIADIAEAFQKNKVDCCFGNLLFVARQNESKITRRWISRDFKNGLFEKSWTPAHPTFYCKREVFLKYGFYRLDFKIAADVELMYRFLQKHQLKFMYLPRFMVKMRDAGISNRNLKSTWIITQEMKQAINENGGNFNYLKYLFFKGLKIKEKLWR